MGTVHEFHTQPLHRTKPNHAIFHANIVQKAVPEGLRPRTARILGGFAPETLKVGLRPPGAQGPEKGARLQKGPQMSEGPLQWHTLWSNKGR